MGEAAEGMGEDAKNGSGEERRASIDAEQSGAWREGRSNDVHGEV